MRAELARTGFALGYHAEVYGDAEEFCSRPPAEGIVIARDEPGRDDVPSLLNRLSEIGVWLPVIAIADDADANRIVTAIKAGAMDYLRLPLDPERFSATLERISDEARASGQFYRRTLDARHRIAHLSNREREVLDWLTEGSSNKAIARELEISPRTVEIHRANMMLKLGAKHSADAVRLRVEAQIESSVRQA